ncbi:hypothetical protein M436DRAFT_62077 [Aureobasidium namibiae CBS 147.97]|uniref:Transcription factor domain-containing protein n=1 Tax=Aureobasidium namibiae CBS 147.97 TaxID=1043004 RepID=A0A074X0Z4_9PEZI
MPGVPSGRGCEGCRKQKKKTMTPLVDLKYNLAWAFGPFLEHVPQRLGRSSALDAAAKAVVAAHSSHCISRRQVSPNALVDYSRALAHLRLAVNDIVTAQTPEILCAIQLLLICQALIGSENRWTGHAEGAARILKARGYRATEVHDDFEAGVIASLSASMLFEGIFNPNMNYPGCIMMRCFSLIPGHLIRGRKMIFEEPGLVADVELNHQKLQALTSASRQCLEQTKASSDTQRPDSTAYAHALYQRAHSINVAVLVLLNRVLYAIDVTSSRDLSQEAEQRSSELLTLTLEAERYAPLGNSYASLCLCAAWIGSSDHDQKTLVESLLLDFYNRNQTAMLVDVLRFKVQELDDLRTARSALSSATSSWLESQDFPC